MNGNFGHHYSDESFRQWVRRFANRAGRTVLNAAFQLFLAAKSPLTPIWAKATCIGALGYLIFPVDAIPDILFGVGHVDDGAVMATAIASVGHYITPDIIDEARLKVNEWLGPDPGAFTGTRA